MATTRTTTTSQREKILKYLMSGKTLTQEQARNRWGIESPSSRINELRKQGHKVVSTRKTRRADGQRRSYVSYSLLG